MDTLPLELVFLIFELIPKITDKRHFLRTCVSYNNITKVSMLNCEKNYKFADFTNIMIYSLMNFTDYSMEKFTIELCHDRYLESIPNHYLTDKNLSLVICASYCNNIALLSVAKQKGCNMNNAINLGALFGVISVIEWGLNNGYDFNFRTCSDAARGGNLNVLKWLRNHGCHWDSWVCSNAARNGDLEMLKWARKNNCNWGRMVIYTAKSMGYLELLQWAIDNGCPTQH